MFTLRKCANLFAPLMIAALLAIAVAGVAPAVEKPASALVTTWYVAPTGNDASTCKSAAAPCLTIDGAIGKALTNDIVLVANGTYTASTGGRVVGVGKSIRLFGGWNDTFTSQTGLSIIDGQNARRGIRVNAGIVATIGRFQIQNGNPAALGGGGILNYGILTLNNSVVTNNYGISGGGILSYGSITVNGSTISNNMGGGGIEALGTVVLNNSTLEHNSPRAAGYDDNSPQPGGAIDPPGASSMVFNNSTLSNNLGRGITGTGSIILNNSTISGTTGGTFYGYDYPEGAAIASSGMLDLNNSTIANNWSGVLNDASTATLTNSILAGNSKDGGATLSDCQGEIWSGGYNLIGSVSTCTFNAADGDKIGTTEMPIDAKLGPLANNGGPTFTHASLEGSPALNAGNPATPGSGGACLPTDQRGRPRTTSAAGACDIGAYESVPLSVVSVKRVEPATTSAAVVHFTVDFGTAVTGVEPLDFVLTTTGNLINTAITGVTGSGSKYTVAVNTGKGRGTIRLDVVDDDGILDAYNGEPLGGPNPDNGNFTSGEVFTIAPPSVVSVNRLNVSPTSANVIKYIVTFSTAVTGVNTVAPFRDFGITTNGLTGATVTAVSGAGKTYTVTVNAGTGSGTLRLDVLDYDTIKDPTSLRPLGGSGVGNGNFVTGQAYTIVPMPQAPTGTSLNPTPTYIWTRLAGVTLYRYQLFRGTTVVYAYAAPASACGAATCSATPTNLLPPGTYSWRVQALSNGVWRAFSPYKVFAVVAAPKAGYWDNLGSWISFYVLPNRAQITRFTYYIYVPSCDQYWEIWSTQTVPIQSGQFSFSGTHAYGSGTFAPNGTTILTRASGTAGLSNLSLPGCGVVSVSGPWNNYWWDSSQPSGGMATGQDMVILRVPDAPFRLFMPMLLQP